jgi:pyruvate/2-oxoglutarate dehydrogenase complex dihydrolipoamide dehydrogenase (E3) component
MAEAERYENLVIGSGEAGKWLTWNLAQAGHRTAVVERKYIGGSCPNIACLPSKNVIRSAKAKWFAKHGDDYGIQSGPVSTDMKGVLNRNHCCTFSCAKGCQDRPNQAKSRYWYAGLKC